MHDAIAARSHEVLPALMSSLHFESFVAWGGVGDLFLGPRFGPNFDPSSERDRRFVDQLVRLDDDKVEAGLLKPIHMLAALRTEPVTDPVIHRSWTPEFCLAHPDPEFRPRPIAPGATTARPV